MIKFDTKARTLNGLRKKLKQSNICDGVLFTVQQWRNDHHKIIIELQQKFSPSQVIIRSSTRKEDTSDTTMAGAFKSLNNIDSTSEQKLIKAVDEVINSYGKSCYCDEEILVQEMLNNISMSGVVFSRDLNTGAPYYVINYDDISGETDTVTSGLTDTSRTLYIHREHIENLRSSRFTALLTAIREIEDVAPPLGLDIEFAITKDEKIFIFQVRRLTVQKNWNPNLSKNINIALSNIQSFIQKRFQPMPGILGSTSVFTEMSDWNPAEMIGVVPRPLACSLYEMLITNSVWAEARAKLGYRDLSGRPLMVNLGGKVYIDVRESFNSFLPSDLPSKIGEKLVSEWLNILKSNPEYHDKIEFDVAITSYSFDLHKNDYLSKILSTSELYTLNESTKRLTDSIILGERTTIGNEIKKIEYLDQKRKTILADKSSHHPIDIARELLNDCKALGTKPFSILARCAFIAESILRSMENQNILSGKSVQLFRNSVVTVLSEFLDSMESLLNNEISRPEFMEKYGHLRPGTYDILSIRYDQREKLFQNSLKHHQVSKSFHLTQGQKEKINQALHKDGMGFNADLLFDFMKKAITGREYAKLVFTRNISDSLELIAEWGMQTGLNRDEISFLTVEQILQSFNYTFHEPLDNHYRALSLKAQETNEIGQALHLPYLIANSSDIFIVPSLKTSPNFITTIRIEAVLCYLTGRELEFLHTKDQIVLIERADPGYDWIFLNPIAGLITKYGGSNSHMAIRCAELDIPAAIGCGEQTFEQLRHASRVLLDCGSKLIVPIR